MVRDPGFEPGSLRLRRSAFTRLAYRAIRGAKVRGALVAAVADRGRAQRARLHPRRCPDFAPVAWRSPGGTVESRWPEGLHWSEVTRPVTTRDYEPWASGGNVEPRRPRRAFGFQTKERGSSPPGTMSRGCAANYYLSVAALALERRLANPSWFALPSVSGFRLVPSEQAPRFWARASARAPGSGSPVPAEAGEFN